MKVIRAEVMGMCFGVRDALKVIEDIQTPQIVTIHGQLVHNEVVQDRMRTNGFAQTGEADRTGIPETSDVLITAHGISDRERVRLTNAGKRLLDTTCPLVTRAHQAAQRLKEEGYFVLIAGRPGHVEVQGIVEDLDRFEVIEAIHDVRHYNEAKLGLIAQTTTPEHLFRCIHEAVMAANPDSEIRLVDTVCLPTKEHQRSLLRLLDQVDAVVVVGGKNSNNTRELAALCRKHGKPAVHVQLSEDLDPDWFREFETVGLTAGTSTLESTIDSVHQALSRLPVALEVS